MLGLALLAAGPALADPWGGPGGPGGPGPWDGPHHRGGPWPWPIVPEMWLLYPPPPPPRPGVVYVAPAPVQAVPASPIYTDQLGRYCREYQTTVVINGQSQPSYGTACRQPDGTWQIVR